MEIKRTNFNFLQFISILMLLILSLSLATALPEVSNGGCQENSIRGNVDDCSSYLICLHGKEIRVPCPSGLQFNQKLKICDWPQNSHCKESDLSSVTPEIPVVTNVTIINSTNSEAQQENEVQVEPSTTPIPLIPHSDTPRFAPYVDVTLPETNLSDIMRKTGQKDFTLAFALGSTGGCIPKWGAEIDLNDPKILADIRAVQSEGGKMIVALGGAIGPYLEHLCHSVQNLVTAYKTVLDIVKTTHLDVDIEAPIDFNLVNSAFAQMQTERPSTTVSYTLMVQAEDYGLNPELGLKAIQSAKEKGVHVDIVNGMTMEYGATSPDWGDSVIGTAKAILRQMKTVWPEKSESQLKRMLGVTPLIGRNFNGKLFLPEHGRKLVNWANTNQIGLLSFWSIGRDNGKCPNGPIKPTCSSIAQTDYEFTKIFQGFKN